MLDGLRYLEGQCNDTVLLDHDENGWQVHPKTGALKLVPTYWHCSLPAGHEGMHNAVVNGQDNWFGDEMVIHKEHGPGNPPPAGLLDLPHTHAQRIAMGRS